MILLEKAKKVKEIRNKIDLLYEILPVSTGKRKNEEKRAEILDKIYSLSKKLKKYL